MLNPLLLWFLPLALLPIVLHLIVLRRLKTVELATLRFLLGSRMQQRRRLWLVELLVMLLRTAAVALLVFVMSRPVLDNLGGLFGGGGGQDVVIVVDTGAAMGLRSGGTTSLERAQQAAEAILSKLDDADHVTLIAAERRPRVVVRSFASQREAVRDRLLQLKPTAGAGDLSAALEEATATEPLGPRTVYVLGDGRRAPWATFGAGHPIHDQDPAPRVVVVKAGATEPVLNAAILGEPPLAGTAAGVARAVVGLPVQLRAAVGLFGDSPEPTVPRLLTVTLDDRQVAQQPIPLTAGDVTYHTFSVTPTRPGALRGRFAIEPDTFADDDEYLFTLQVEPKLSVLVVAPAPAPRDDAPSDSGLYIEAALAAPAQAETAELFAADTRRIAQAIQVKRVTVDKLSQSMLEGSAAVVLADAPLNDDQAKLVQRYVEQGGGLVILPGPAVSVDRYNERVFGGEDGPIRFAEPVGDLDDPAHFAALRDPDLTHPLLRAFRGDGRDTDYFGTVRLYRRWPLQLPDTTPAAAPGGAAVLLSTADGQPALVDASIGRGRVVVAAFPAGPRWSNAPLRPLFVPLLLRAVTHVWSPPSVSVPAVIEPGAPAVVQITDRWPAAKVEVVTPAGQRQALDTRRADAGFVAAALDTAAKGFYSFNVTPRADDAPDAVELGVAVNLDPAASRFDALDDEELSRLMSPLEPLVIAGTPEEATIGEQLTQRRETWRTLIWIVFAVIGAEFLLSTLAPKRRADDPLAPPAKPGIVSRVRRALSAEPLEAGSTP